MKMHLFLTLLSAVAVLIAGCVATPQMTVKLSSPVNGSTVPTLSPVLAWGGGGGSNAFRVLIATDNNFQDIIIDASNLHDATYVIPSGKLSNATSYFWKAIATRGSATSDWSSPWSFQTPPGTSPAKPGTIRVTATIDGSPWSGNVNYAVTGPFSDTDNSLPWSFGDVPSGAYTLTYNYGGPEGASLAGITPSPTQDLPAGGTIHFILNFHKQSISNITVNATLNGLPWTGTVNYSLSGAVNVSGSNTPQSFTNLPSGSYTFVYRSGSPAGAILTGITPSTTLNLPPAGNIIYTLNFATQQTYGNIVVNANLNGSPWSGMINFQLTGPFQNIDNAVPRTYTTTPAGNYTLGYIGGGPSGAILTGITPAVSQILANGSTIVFNLNFTAQPSTGNIIVEALLDGQSWKTQLGSGVISFSLAGPQNYSANAIPSQFSSMAAGRYTLIFNNGGPIGSTLTHITPAPSQNLTPGGTIVFTLNFTGQPKGTIIVNATINGQPWTGPVGYTLNGPYVESGSITPRNFSNAPSGSYTLQYKAGGPPGAIFEGVSPPSQILPPGGTASFTIIFNFMRPIPTPIPGPLPGPVPEPTPGPLR
jgi:hypothetical protein